MQTSKNTHYRFSNRVSNIPKSFLREILKVTAQPDVISFAGGLPNPASFPIEAIKLATSKVLSNDGASVLQYATSEGYLPLRQYIADRYAQKGMQVNANEILITNGSQQGLDLIGKVFINEGDDVILEKPSYLGAIQAFSTYQPNFITTSLLEDGVDTVELDWLLKNKDAKLFYAIPNFQNPTGISYSDVKRKQVAESILQSQTLLVEDDPYGDIKFTNKEYTPIKKYVKDRGILLGSFSKIISPGMRMGWIVAAPEIIEKLLLAKQATDLHSNYFTQRVIYQFLTDNNIDDHITKIIDLYKSQKEYMIRCMKQHFPDEVRFTNPEGGMFIWLTLPSFMSSYTLLDHASKEKLAFVPGKVFYLDDAINNTLR
ncbi:MAG TPA: PLP-dependent aminotransferase family protein, partial [Cyclobacteriaceae bacterium]